MLILITEALINGIITLLIGIILFNQSINKNNKKNNHPFGVDIAFFITGIILDIFIKFLDYKFNN